MQVGGSGGRSPPGKQGGFGGAAGPPNGGPLSSMRNFLQVVIPGDYVIRRIFWGGMSEGGEGIFLGGMNAIPWDD